MRLYSLLLSSGIAALAMTTSGQAQPTLNAAEKKSLIFELNQICGDTWCGGDLDFQIIDLNCTGDRACELEITAQGYAYDGIEFPRETFRCELAEVSERRDLLRYRSSGLTYTEVLYDAVSDCVRNEVEAVLLPLTLPAVPLSETSCLELIESKPRIAEGYADVFYKIANTELFAETFYEGFLARLAKKTGCQLPDFPTPQFECAEFELAAPICGAETKEFRIGLVKDFVDSARFVVSNKSPKKKVQIPGIAYQYNWQTLYLPNPAFCYDGLLDQQLDSQVFPVDISQWLPAKDKRFVMAETLRFLVGQKSVGYYEDSCDTKIFEYPARDVTCQYLGETGLDACVITPDDGGYYVFVWSDGDPKLNFIFNRYD